MKVVCNKCKEEFVIEVKEREYKDNIKETYFSCPNCSEDYHVLFSNIHTDKLRDTLGTLLLHMGREYSTRKIRREYERTKRKLERATKNLYRKLGKEDMYPGL